LASCEYTKGTYTSSRSRVHPACGAVKVTFLNSQCGRAGAAIIDSVAKQYGQYCPVAKSLDLVGERWTLLIVRDLLRSPAPFQDPRAQLPGLPPKLLADRLRRLERQRLVTRELYSKRPPRASYALTDRGRSLGLVVGALAVWGRPLVSPRSGPRHATCGHPTELQHYCPHCEERVAPDAVHVPNVAPLAARRRRVASTPTWLSRNRGRPARDGGEISRKKVHSRPPRTPPIAP